MKPPKRIYWCGDDKPGRTLEAQYKIRNYGKYCPNHRNGKCGGNNYRPCRVYVYERVKTAPRIIGTTAAAVSIKIGKEKERRQEK